MKTLNIEIDRLNLVYWRSIYYSDPALRGNPPGIKYREPNNGAFINTDIWDLDLLREYLKSIYCVDNINLFEKLKDKRQLYI